MILYTNASCLRHFCSLYCSYEMHLFELFLHVLQENKARRWHMDMEPI